jgi:putative nucleotidyltransferase with HDIG domain
MLNQDNNLFKKILEKKVAGVPLSNLSVKLGYLLLLILIIPFLFPSGRSFKFTDLRVGSIVNKKVIAPFTYPVLKTEEELRTERQHAREKVLHIFEKNPQVVETQIQNLHDIITLLGEPGLDKRFQAVLQREDKLPDSLLFTLSEKLYALWRVNLELDELHTLIIQVHRSARHTLSTTLVAALQILYRENLIDLPIKNITHPGITLIDNGIEEDINVTSLLDTDTKAEVISNLALKLENAGIWKKILQQLFIPNVIFNRILTEQRQRDAVALVPTAKDMVYENERIIDANERVTAGIYQKLLSLDVATAERHADNGTFRDLLSRISRYLLTALILFIFILYLIINRPEIIRDNKKVLLLAILILLQVVLASIMVVTLGLPSYLLPTTISSMLLGILFEPAIGFVGTVIIALLLGGIVGFDYFFIMVSSFVGLVAIFSVAEIRTRNQIFKAIFYLIIAYALTALTLGILNYEDFNDILKKFVFYMLPNAILSPIITYMTLGLFERLFDLTTDVTLLELSDLNHPLLKELSLKAPGTFHHSVIIGNLAEAAAKAIDANPLLARVGSYYHDIGKIDRPEYFMENEATGENRHKSLAPNMSALILASHVKTGLELAEKYKLPRDVRNFIPEHHGINLMAYFYNKALETQPDSEIHEADYRYPGPSPHSKETAIVMLADTVEAAARSLTNPTPGRLRKLAEELIEKRFLEGELDDSDLTMRDLKAIIDAFIPVLTGIYHKRVQYPKSDEKKASRPRKEPVLKPQNNDNTNSQPSN